MLISQILAMAQADQGGVHVNNPVRVLVISLGEELNTSNHPISSQVIDTVINRCYGRIHTEFEAGAYAAAHAVSPKELSKSMAAALQNYGRSDLPAEDRVFYLAWLAGAGAQSKEVTA